MKTTSDDADEAPPPYIATADSSRIPGPNQEAGIDVANTCSFQNPQDGVEDNNNKPEKTPPPYTATAGPSRSPMAEKGVGIDVTAAFSSLKLRDGIASNGLPEVDTCLAHLKLLFAFESMKHEVGYTNGLFGLWDSRAIPQPERDGKSQKTQKKRAEPIQLDGETLEYLSQIREKRWSLFVTQAVDRYISWWEYLVAAHPNDTRRLVEDDMKSGAANCRSRYSSFPTGRNQASDDEAFVEKALYVMPLDVLMVWHAHMLSPRAYLEDCMRTQYVHLWRLGFPWKTISTHIHNDTFDYEPPLSAQHRWSKLMGRPWNNMDEPNTKLIKCGGCEKLHQQPLTTCQANPGELIKDPSTLEGIGYGDAKTQLTCPDCHIEITKDSLSVAQLFTDARRLISHQEPMAGTILYPHTGIPATEEPDAHVYTFPNRVITTAVLHSWLCLDAATLRSMSRNASMITMADVRTSLGFICCDVDKVCKVNGVSNPNSAGVQACIRPVANFAVRKMMARYCDNTGPLGLDLIGAVLRQGAFCTKMCKLDWLHSPIAEITMNGLLIKYFNFMGLISSTIPPKLRVPTLDVDLAWHTHQLSPKSYYLFTTTKCGLYVDHDDKVSENKLGEAFAQTSRAYQKRYGQVYSECVCWYCEAIRASTTTNLAAKLGWSVQQKVNDEFNNSGRAAELSCANSTNTNVHISTHNSVRVEPPSNYSHNAKQEWIKKFRKLVHQKRIDAGYAMAVKKAARKGREIDERTMDCADHWGYTNTNGYAFPWAFPMPAYPYAISPGLVDHSAAVNGEDRAAVCVGRCGNGSECNSGWLCGSL